jgi:hsp70-interacting protein
MTKLTRQLVEMIDNANNLTVLNLWQPLLALLQSPEQDIVKHACWICGTAVQNNLKAQAAVSGS